MPGTHKRDFQAGEHILVLLPLSRSKLLAQWQSPYPVVCRVRAATYEIKMYNTRKPRRILHVNILRKWHPPNTSCPFLEEAAAIDEGPDKVVM